MVDMLLKRGASPEARDHAGKSAVVWSAILGLEGIMTLFVDHAKDGG
jgi:ankyrin repeat protein